MSEATPRGRAHEVDSQEQTCVGVRAESTGAGTALTERLHFFGCGVAYGQRLNSVSVMSGALLVERIPEKGLKLHLA